MMMKITVLGLAVVVGFFILIGNEHERSNRSSKPTPVVDNSINTFCREKPGEAASGYQSWVDARVIVDRVDKTVRVDERRWEATSHDGKISLALDAYCVIGLGYVAIEGWHDGEHKAAVVDGNYMD